MATEAMSTEVMSTEAMCTGARKALRLLDVAASVGRQPTTDAGDGSVTSLLQVLDRFGIDSAVVTHSLATHHDAAAGNQRLLKEVAEHPRLHPSWVVLPTSCGELPPGPVLVEQARTAGVGLLVARPTAHGYDVESPDLAPLLDAAAGTGLPIMIQSDQTSWAALERIATTHPQLWLIVTDVGYRTLRRVCGLLERHPRLLLSTANLSGHLALEYLVERFGAHRLVFGTGLPVRDPGEAVTRLRLSELDDEDVRQIGGATMRALLAGDQLEDDRHA